MSWLVSLGKNSNKNTKQFSWRNFQLLVEFLKLFSFETRQSNSSSRFAPCLRMKSALIHHFAPPRAHSG